MKNNPDNLGFTLIEILIVVVLVGATLVVLSDMFLNQNRIYRSQNAELEITGSVRESLDDIDNSVRMATRVAQSNGSYITGPQVLVLQVQSINSSQRLIGGTFDYIIYYLSNGNLMKTVVPDPSSSRPALTKAEGTKISGLTFIYNNTDLTRVTEVATSVAASSSAGPQTRTFTVDSKARLRNY